MDIPQLTPLAEVLVQSYLETAVYSRQFTVSYKQPPTTMAKVHHLRAIAQARVAGHDQLRLCPEFVEYGKLQVVDLKTNRIYLVRSSAAVEIEDRRQMVLFPREMPETSVIMVIHKFQRDGLDLSVTGTREQPGRLRLVASGPATFIATWPYATGPTSLPFDQGEEDPFWELGDIAEDDEPEDVG